MTLLKQRRSGYWEQTDPAVMRKREAKLCDRNHRRVRAGFHIAQGTNEFASAVVCGAVEK